MSEHEIPERLTSYRLNGLNQVEGWFDDESAEVIEMLLRRQLSWGIRGNVAEIGVHHGKSFLLLANGLREDECAVALDVFGDQEKNLDHSGAGDRDRFEANATTWAPGARILVEQRSSLEVSPAAASETFGKVRMFSIDGGHTSEVTSHDLRVAEGCVGEDGVVVLDDVLNPHWLGVLTGLSQYLSAEHALQPFAYSSNKLYFATTAESAERYAAALRADAADLLGKTGVEFFDRTIDIYGQGSARRRHEARQRQRSGSKAEQELKAALSTMHSQERRLRRELTSSRRRLDELTSSTSWRVTAGPRAVSRLLRSRNRGSR